MGARFYIIFATIVFANFSFAQPKPRLSHCLKNAHSIMQEAIKNDGKYFDSEDKLKAKLSEGCQALAYNISLRGEKGFRVVAEDRGETWSVDENEDFVRAARITAPVQAKATTTKEAARVPIVTAPSQLAPRSNPDPAPAPAPPPATAPAPPTTTTSGPSSSAASMYTQLNNKEAARIVPSAVLASDRTPPMVPVPQFVPNVNFMASSANKPGGEPTRLERCFTRRLFYTKACTALFSDLDGKCGKGSDQVPTICLELSRQLAATNLDDCVFSGPGAEENFGKCELRAQQLKKVCANPLKEFSFECRSLTKFENASSAHAASPVGIPPLIAAPSVTRNLAGAADDLGASPPMVTTFASSLPSEKTSISSIRNVQTLDSALRKLLKMRAVSYESKETMQREVGFVAEEVEMVDPLYVQYVDKNVHGVKVPQLTALIAGSIQELYGMCRGDSDLQRDLIKRLVGLENENAELKRDVDRQARELLIIKAKLGLK